MRNISLAGACALALTLIAIPAHAHNQSLPDDHAPIGVMGDHNHKQGEWMTSYRYSNMHMEGARDGTSDLSTSQVLSNFMMAPLEMDMEMHMAGVMYGVTDRLTVMGMVPYIDKTMKSINRMGMTSKLKTDGVGDVKLSGLYTLFESEPDSEHHRVSEKLLLGFGASLPTGSIDERGNTMMGANQKLAYSMQLGSGTVDPMLRLTYIRKYGWGSWGVQGNTVLRFGENDEGYRLGNEYVATAWAAKNLNQYASLSLRVEGKTWGDIHGSDPDLNPMMSPAARTDLRGGERVDAFIGLNLIQNEGALSGHRLAAELGVPVYQRLDGPQMKADYRFTLGWQWAL